MCRFKLSLEFFVSSVINKSLSFFSGINFRLTVYYVMLSWISIIIDIWCYAVVNTNTLCPRKTRQV